MASLYSCPILTPYEWSKMGLQVHLRNLIKAFSGCKVSVVYLWKAIRCQKWTKDCVFKLNQIALLVALAAYSNKPLE